MSKLLLTDAQIRVRDKIIERAEEYDYGLVFDLFDHAARLEAALRQISDLHKQGPTWDAPLGWTAGAQDAGDIANDALTGER